MEACWCELRRQVNCCSVSRLTSKFPHVCVELDFMSSASSVVCMTWKQEYNLDSLQIELGTLASIIFNTVLQIKMEIFHEILLYMLLFLFCHYFLIFKNNSLTNENCVYLRYTMQWHMYINAVQWYVFCIMVTTIKLINTSITIHAIS